MLTATAATQLNFKTKMQENEYRNTMLSGYRFSE